MKVVQINGGVFGSTGKIMFGIAELAERHGFETMCVSPITTTNRTKQPAHEYVRMGTFTSRRINVLLDRVTGMHNCHAAYATWKLLKQLDEFRPDVIHLHNLHGGYIHLGMLFRYIKRNHIRTVWTLHDCWAFTAYCPHFDMIGCEKWKDGCHDCPQYRQYPVSYVDRSKRMYQKKKDWFTGVEDLTVVTPSHWLAGLVKESFLKDYPVQVIHNGIDLTVFRPTESDFREKYHCENKKILLGVAFGWGVKKGLDVFVELARRLDDSYQIVLVGTSEEIDRQLPENMISIHRTQDQRELAEIYTAADLLVNPTREETYPTVNMEAIACGTPVVTFRTGGSPESLDEDCGMVVEKDNMEALERMILTFGRKDSCMAAKCRKKGIGFAKEDSLKGYLRIYRKKGFE